jgi:hypothetical protein
MVYNTQSSIILCTRLIKGYSSATTAHYANTSSNLYQRTYELSCLVMNTWPSRYISLQFSTTHTIKKKGFYSSMNCDSSEEVLSGYQPGSVVLLS